MSTSSYPIVLVSGGNSGLGLATAKRLATEHKYTVIIGSRNPKAGEDLALEFQSQGLAISSVQLDITSDDSIAAAINHIITTFGRLDILINNAGIMLDQFRDEMGTRDLFTRTFSTNIIGAACLTEACLPLLRNSALPRIIFISSVMGSITKALDKTTAWYGVDYKAYDSSKAALNMLAVNYDRILADKNGLVNVVCPGLVSSNLSEFVKAYGEAPEVGAQRVVELAVAEKGSVTGTFSDRNGGIPW